MMASSLPPFLDKYSLCHHLDVKPFEYSSTFLSFGLFVWVSPLSSLRMAPGYHIYGDWSNLYPFYEISIAELGFEKISHFFVYLNLFDGIHFLYFCFLTILLWILTQDLAWGKVVIICIQRVYAFCCLFWLILFSAIDCNLLRRWTVPQEAVFFCIPYRMGLPGILKMCLFVVFLDHIQGYHYYWHGGSLRRPIFFSFYFQVFIFTYFMIILWLICCNLFGRCLWCNGYRRRKLTRRHEFKSWTRLIAFHKASLEGYESNYFRPAMGK